MPFTENDLDPTRITWQEDAGTQLLAFGPPGPGVTDSEVVCWIDVSGIAFTLDADTVRSLARLFRAVDGSEVANVSRLPRPTA
ncbi:hypothetical protein AB0J43_02130 [Nonomuraea fuscirosea]